MFPENIKAVLLLCLFDKRQPIDQRDQKQYQVCEIKDCWF